MTRLTIPVLVSGRTVGGMTVVSTSVPVAVAAAAYAWCRCLSDEMSIVRTCRATTPSSVVATTSMFSTAMIIISWVTNVIDATAVADAIGLTVAKDVEHGLLGITSCSDVVKCTAKGTMLMHVDLSPVVPCPGVSGIPDALPILDLTVTDGRVDMSVAELMLILVGLSSDMLSD